MNFEILIELPPKCNYISFEIHGQIINQSCYIYCIFALASNKKCPFTTSFASEIFD
jgi:hypothetical protein